MVRPVEIDREASLQVALHLFWRRGYGATLMSDLLDAMQISSSSFYAAFGSKRDLFKSVLDKYVERSERTFAVADTKGQGLDALQAFLDGKIASRPAPERLRGCLLVNSVLELEDVDEDLHRQATRAMKSLRVWIIRWLTDAESAGQLRKDVEFESIVDTVELAVSGLRVASREGDGRAALRRRISSLLALISAPEVTHRQH